MSSASYGRMVINGHGRPAVAAGSNAVASGRSRVRFGVMPVRTPGINNVDGDDLEVADKANPGELCTNDYIELFNLTTSVVNIAGMAIIDDHGHGHVETHIPTGRVPIDPRRRRVSDALQGDDRGDGWPRCELASLRHLWRRFHHVRSLRPVWRRRAGRHRPLRQRLPCDPHRYDLAAARRLHRELRPPHAGLALHGHAAYRRPAEHAAFAAVSPTRANAVAAVAAAAAAASLATTAAVATATVAVAAPATPAALTAVAPDECGHQ